MKTRNNVERISKVLEEISAPMRMAILLSIGNGEACVCHLEAILGKRQAYISQHLMALREAGLITSRREGHFVFYRLANPAVLDLIRDAGRLVGADITTPVLTAVCECPPCAQKRHEGKFDYSPG
jgi:DNA-binding transcriptional ArsR family regulator